MYACIDPVYMTLLSRLLGRKYIVWDKAAAIEFRKAGRSTLYSTFVLPKGTVEGIRADLESAERVDRIFDVELVDRHGVVHVACKKTITIKRRKSLQ
jgi:hypothetical protein